MTRTDRPLIPFRPATVAAALALACAALLLAGAPAGIAATPAGQQAKSKTVRGCTIKPFAPCSGMNLSRAKLKGADLRGANLSNANLRRADLRGANLQGINLTRADLTGADMRGANLTAFPLSLAYQCVNQDPARCGASLNQAKLVGTRMDKIKTFSYGPIVDINTFHACCELQLVQADMRRASMRGVTFASVAFVGANLEGADLTGATIAWTIVDVNPAKPQVKGNSSIRWISSICSQNTAEEQAANPSLGLYNPYPGSPHLTPPEGTSPPCF